MRRYIGIDIGKKGGVAILGENKKVVLHKIPMIKKEVDYHQINRMLSNYQMFVDY